MKDESLFETRFQVVWNEHASVASNLVGCSQAVVIGICLLVEKTYAYVRDMCCKLPLLCCAVHEVSVLVPNLQATGFELEARMSEAGREQSGYSEEEQFFKIFLLHFLLFPSRERKSWPKRGGGSVIPHVLKLGRRRLHPRERAHGTRRSKGWMGPGGGVKALEKTNLQPLPAVEARVFRFRPIFQSLSILIPGFYC